MHHRKDAKQTAYCRQQALACANAALSTAIGEVKEAYLNLEQGWLCLAPRLRQTPTVFPIRVARLRKGVRPQALR
jgi:hypothetical protein